MSFGAFNNNPAPSTSLFGAQSQTNQQQNQPTTTIFGSTQQNPQQQQQQPFIATPSLFGQQQQQPQQQQQQQQQPQQQQPSLFGNTNQTLTNGTPSLFGGQQQQNQQLAQTGGNMFGGASATAAPAGTGLFGNNQQQQQQPQPGLFNSTAPKPLFGSTMNNNNNTTLPANGSIFGQAPKPATPLFGAQATNAANPTQASGSLFGGNQQQQQQPSLFGGNQQQQQQPSIFGQSQQQQPAPSMFGTSTLGSSILGAPAANNMGMSSSFLPTRGPVMSNPATTAQQFELLKQRIEGIALAWSSNSPGCRFQHYFYNLVDPNQVSLYGRPANATNEALWQKAVRENPDPKCLVPVLATGFDDLRQRVDAQMQQATEHQNKLNELKTCLSALQHRHAISNSSRLSRASSQQTQLTHRLLAFIQHLHLLIPALRSSAIRPEEEELRQQLEEIEDEVRKGRARSRLNELWAIVGALTAAKERGDGNGTDGRGAEWAIVDENGLAQIAQILGEQQAGLAYLTKMLQKDLKDLGVITGAPSQSAMPGQDSDFGVGYHDDYRPSSSIGGGSILGSTLRASALR